MGRYRPVIAVTPAYDSEKGISCINTGYCDGIMEAGGVPILMPLTVDHHVIDIIIKKCDGLMVTGGPDLDARLYGEQNYQFNGEISPLRDEMEIYAIRTAFEGGKPILGICRGIQVINVTFGGTLYQDIYAQSNRKDMIKHSQSAPRWYPTHEIIIEKGSKVWSAFGSEKAAVNSFHHQAVKDVAPGFKVSSRAPDGIIESIEHETDRFVVGVQWHPEHMWKNDGIYLELFRMFVDSCKQGC